MPKDFLISENTRQKVIDTVNRIENSIHINQDVQSAYNDFHKLITDEMEDELPILNRRNTENRRAKSLYKPYWNQTLQDQWNLTCRCEKEWLKFNGPPQRKRVKEKYCTERKVLID